MHSFVFMYGMTLLCCWRGHSSALLGARLSERTRAGRVPASYPTASTRKLMGPIADARTDHEVYAAITGIFEITIII